MPAMQKRVEKRGAGAGGCDGFETVKVQLTELGFRSSFVDASGLTRQ
jgi:hypothetical protein